MKTRELLLALFTICGPIGCAATSIETKIAQERRLTSTKAAESFVRVSPDGKRLAFDASIDGETHIYILDLESGRQSPLAGARKGGRRPAWAPDGERIAYVDKADGKDEIRIATLVGNTDTLFFRGELGERFSAPDWSPDGAHVAFSRTTPTDDGAKTIILVVETDTGDAFEATHGGDEWWPRWGPNSEKLVYYIGESDEIRAVDFKTGTQHSISRGAYTGWRPQITPDGESVIFISELEKWSVWIAPMDGSHPPVRLTTISEDAFPDASPGDGSLFYVKRTNESVALKQNLETDEIVEISRQAARPQEGSDGGVAFLSLDSDTRKIVFSTDRGQILRAVKYDEGPLIDFAISQSAQKIALVTMGFLDGNYRIEILNAEGSRTGVHTINRRAEKPVWCDDGKTILYSAKDDNRPNWLIWSLDVETANSSPLFETDMDLRPSDCRLKDGRIAAQTFGGNSVTTIMEQRDVDWVEHSTFNGSSARWSPDGGRLIFVDQPSGQTDLFQRDENGAVTRITNDDRAEASPSWSNDGENIIYAVSTEERDIWVLNTPDLPWR